MNKTSYPILHILAASLIAATAVGCASGNKPARKFAPPPPSFAGADANQDRQVTAAEWDARSDVLFDQLDVDDSGFIETAELEGSFAVIDRDGDQQIEPEESRSVVRVADRDGDGQVSRAEFERNDWSEISSDLDRDGRISRKEFRRSRREVFDAADQDRDGSLRYVRGQKLDPGNRMTIFRF